MIPRVRLTYVHGLASLHEEVAAPREVDLTTDGTFLVIRPPASTRPLAKLPLASVAGCELRADLPDDVAPSVFGSPLVSRLLSGGNIVVVRFDAGAGIPAAVAGRPILFVAASSGERTAILAGIRELLQPRTAIQMARLERGDRMRSTYVSMVVLALTAIVVVSAAIFLVQALGPRPRQGAPAVVVLQ